MSFQTPLLFCLSLPSICPRQKWLFLQSNLFFSLTGTISHPVINTFLSSSLFCWYPQHVRCGFFILSVKQFSVFLLLFFQTFNQIESFSPRKGSKHLDLGRKKTSTSFQLGDMTKNPIFNKRNTNAIPVLNTFISTLLNDFKKGTVQNNVELDSVFVLPSRGEVQKIQCFWWWHSDCCCFVNCFGSKTLATLHHFCLRCCNRSDVDIG